MGAICGNGDIESRRVAHRKKSSQPRERISVSPIIRTLQLHLSLGKPRKRRFYGEAFDNLSGFECRSSKFATTMSGSSKIRLNLRGDACSKQSSNITSTKLSANVMSLSLGQPDSNRTLSTQGRCSTKTRQSSDSVPPSKTPSSILGQSAPLRSLSRGDQADRRRLL